MLEETNDFDSVSFGKRQLWNGVFAGIFGILAILLLLGSLAASLSLYSYETPGLRSWEFIVALVSLIVGGSIIGRINALGSSKSVAAFHGFLLWAVVCCGFLFIDPHTYLGEGNAVHWNAILGRPFRSFLPENPTGSSIGIFGMILSLCSAIGGSLLGSISSGLEFRGISWRVRFNKPRHV